MEHFLVKMFIITFMQNRNFIQKLLFNIIYSNNYNENIKKKVLERFD